MATITAKQVFKIAFKGNGNFLTPNIAKMGSLFPNNSHRYYELSWGFGMFDTANTRIYGVTLVDYDIATGQTSRPEGLSRVFNHSTDDLVNKAAAEAYIAMLAYDKQETIDAWIAANGEGV